MKSIEDLGKEMFIFGSIFLLANKLQTMIDQEMSEFGITAKQWFLMVIIEEFFPEPPAVKKVAEFMGTSHQNVKQLALKLEKNGFLRLEKNKKDKRTVKLILTKKSALLGQSRSNENLRFFNELFSGMEQEELRVMSEGFRKLNKNINEINVADI